MVVQKFTKIDLKVSTNHFTYYPFSEIKELNLSPNQKIILENIVDFIKTAKNTILELLYDKYKDIKNVLPLHFTETCLIMITCCSDGVIIRYDKYETNLVVCTWLEKTLTELSPVLSENFIYCIDKNTSLDWMNSGVEIQLSKVDTNNNEEIVLNERVASIVEMSDNSLFENRGFPSRIIQATNSIVIELHGIELSKEDKFHEQGKPCIVRMPMEIGVGWCGFEIFRSYHFDQWNQKLADFWAEQEILLYITQYNTKKEKLLALDPMFNARKYFLALIQQFDEVLQKAKKEEELQQFLKDNPILIEPTYKNVFPKLPFGPHITDFVFERATGDYLLVELEHPAKQLFTKKGYQSADLTQSIGQIMDWYRYIEDNLSTVQKELNLHKITPNTKSLIVIGRRSTLDSSLQRKLAILSGQSPNIKIFTYDDLRDQTLTTFENMVGSLYQQLGQTEIYYPKIDSKFWSVNLNSQDI
jgi:hypothetical protein